MTKKTIGFFGDSYCNNWPKYENMEFETYIDMLSKHYDADIVNLGYGGSSAGDAMINQFLPFVQSNTVPDICIFVWTSADRLFHRTERILNYNSVKDNSRKGPVWKAANEYYEQIYDYEFSNFKHSALLSHFDNTVLSSLSKATKIVHLWSYGYPKQWGIDYFSPTKLEYHHIWKNGIEIRPSLFTVGLIPDTTTVSGCVEDQGPNHLGTREKNEIVFEWIKNAIDLQGKENNE